MSYALHGAGLLDAAMPSGAFKDWGEDGPGTWVTIYANGGHMYMTVAGLRFDTSARRSVGGRLDDRVAAVERLHRPPPRRPVAVRRAAALAGALLGALALAPAAGAQSVADLCATAKPGTQCQPGNNRQTPGGGDKASHDGWPAISGVFWKVLDGEPRLRGRAAERRAPRPPRRRRHPRRPRRRRDLG